MTTLPENIMHMMRGATVTEREARQHERAAWKAGVEYDQTANPSAAFNRVYPVHKIRRMREAVDANGLRWRCDGTHVEYRSPEAGVWSHVRPDLFAGLTGDVPSRLRAVAEVLETPFEEVDDAGTGVAS